jgi:hypothetical protein
MADFALPQTLSISDVKRNAMAAVRRTVIHGDTSQNSYGAGEIVYLNLATGTAGAFWDVSTSRLEMTVNVYNKNYFVDFFNLPRCGFNALIEEMGIEVHNSLHENQRFYAETIEQLMIRNGENMVPYEMTVSNPHEVGGGIAGELHINLIKPSMVTTAGLPHGVRYAVMIQPSGSNVSSSVANILSEGLLLNAHPYLKKACGRNGYGDIALYANDNSINTAGFVGKSDTASEDLDGEFGWWANTNLPSSSVYDDRIPRGMVMENYYVDRTYVSHPATITTNSRAYIVKPTANTTPVVGGATFGDDVNISTTNRFYGTASAGGGYSKIIPRIKEFGYKDADNTMFDVWYGQTLGCYTPMMWPAKQPCNFEKLQKQVKDARRGVNTKNVQNYYANCKNISCAIPVNLTTDPYGKNFWGGNGTESTLPIMSDSTKGEKYSFRISLKFYSCLLGVFAKKWFPSLLIGAGRMRIRMKLQQPNIVFQTLMDPCRIVPKTARDRFPYLGVSKTTGCALQNLTEGAITNVAHAIHPILISDYIPGSCFNDLVAIGRFPVPQMQMKAMSRPMGVYNTLNRNAAYDTAGTTHTDSALLHATTHADDISNNPYITGAAHGIPTHINHLIALIPPENLPAANSWDTPHYKNRASADLVYEDGAEHNDVTLGSADFTNLWTAERFGAVYKVLTDVITELTHNVHYGFPPLPIKAEGVFKKVTNATDPGLTTDIRYTQGVLHDTSPIYAYQNYHWATDHTHLFTDYGKTGSTMDYSAGTAGTTQKIWQSAHEEANRPMNDFKSSGLNWDPFSYPVPQYVPMKNPWDKTPTRTFVADDFLNESELCYGTYLERSVAQVRRTNKNLFALGTDSAYYPGITERLTYTVSNIAFRCEEVILPESASMQIIASAMEGGITMEAETIKSIEQILQKQDNQKILLNVSAGLINDVCCVFQPTELIQGDKAYGYNSFAFYCPWTSFKFMKQATGTEDKQIVNTVTKKDIPSTPDAYNYLGGEPQFYNGLTFGDNIGINTYMTISTEFFPRMPINDLQTLIDHVTWGDQRRGDVEYLGLEPMIHNAYDAANFQNILPFQDGFFSVFTPIETLNDQTITDNPYWTPLECNTQKVIRGRRAKLPALPFFKPLDGTFHLSFNTQAFMNQHERMNVGSPMVNTNSYLHMQNCHMFREHETRMIVFIRVFARIVIERGGILQIFT